MRTSESLAIQVSPPRRSDSVYTNGDKITGEVMQRAWGNLSVDKLIIRFKGKVKSAVSTGTRENRRTHHAKSVLFEFTKELVLPRHPFRGGNSWPFEFEFPWCTSSAKQPNSFGPCDRFEHQPGFPLPPSFDGEEKLQRISHYLEVVGDIHTPAFFSEYAKNRAYLSFEPSRLVESPSLDLFSRISTRTRISKQLDPKLAEYQPGCWETVRQCFCGTTRTETDSPIFS